MTWERTVSPVHPEGAVGLLLIHKWSVLWFMCETPSMREIPVWICADFVHRYFSMISGNPSWTSKTTCSCNLDFFFFEIWRNLAVWLPCVLHCGYLQGNKHTDVSLHIVTSGFLFLLYFLYETILIKNFCQMYGGFFVCLFFI